jgi:hypothetical protein
MPLSFADHGSVVVSTGLPMNVMRHPEDWVTRTDGLKLDSPLSTRNLELASGFNTPAAMAETVRIILFTPFPSDASADDGRQYGRVPTIPTAPVFLDPALLSSPDAQAGLSLPCNGCRNPPRTHFTIHVRHAGRFRRSTDACAAHPICYSEWSCRRTSQTTIYNGA